MIFLVSTMMISEFTVGIVTGSLALLADSFHMLADVFALFVALASRKAILSKNKQTKNTNVWKVQFSLYFCSYRKGTNHINTPSDSKELVSILFCKISTIFDAHSNIIFFSSCSKETIGGLINSVFLISTSLFITTEAIGRFVTLTGTKYCILFSYLVLKQDIWQMQRWRIQLPL